MGVIFDGCIWLGLAAGVMSRQAVIAAAGEAPVFTSAISLGELRFGVEVCSDPTERAIRAAWLRQVEARPVLGVTKDTAAAFGVLAAAVRQAGLSPRPRYNDVWIAAQAIEHGYALLTIKPGDFSGLPGLRLLTLGGGRRSAAIASGNQARPSWARASQGAESWLGRLDSNQGMAVPKTAALPLGYAPSTGEIQRVQRPYIE